MKLDRVEKYDIVVFSPHLDDAVLSLGSHIIKWKKEGKKIKVITVFTKFGNGKNIPKYSRDYLIKSGFKNITDFEKARILEDKEAMEKMGVDFEHWGFIDAGFRGIYKSREKLLGGKIDNKDKIMFKKIQKKIKNISAKLLLVPFGVGGHVDHLILNKATKRINNKNFYLDVPYLWKNFNFIKLFWKIIRAKSVMRGGEKKNEILKFYKSQYYLLVRNNESFTEVVI